MEESSTRHLHTSCFYTVWFLLSVFWWCLLYLALDKWKKNVANLKVGSDSPYRHHNGATQLKNRAQSFDWTERNVRLRVPYCKSHAYWTWHTSGSQIAAHKYCCVSLSVKIINHSGIQRMFCFMWVFSQQEWMNAHGRVEKPF